MLKFYHEHHEPDVYLVPNYLWKFLMPLSSGIINNIKMKKIDITAVIEFLSQIFHPHSAESVFLVCDLEPCSVN